MMDVSENFCRILVGREHTEMLWLCRKTDWFKLLHLPDVSWLQLVAAALCLVVVIWVIVRFVSRVNEDVDPAEADREMLQSLDDLWRQGDLTEDEFRSIKSQIMGRLKTSWNVTPKTSSRADFAKLAQKPSNDDNKLNESFVNRSETNDLKPSASQSIQSENIASPTNVPGPTQDTTHRAERRMPLESENSEGNMEAGPRAE